MANGDAAAAAGMDVVPASADARLGYDEINKSRDYIATRTSAVTPVNKGGTGATAAAAARTNLGITLSASAIDGTTMLRGAGGRTNVGTPVDPTNAATKAYTDSAAASAAASAVSNRAVLGSDVSFGHIYTPAGRATPVVTSYVSAYLNSDGRIGATPSSRRFKRDIQAWSPDLQAVFAMQLVTYRLTKNVYGSEDTPVQVGLIAEELVDLGLSWLVWFDDEGLPASVHYEHVALALLPAVQDLNTRLTAIEARLNGDPNA